MAAKQHHNNLDVVISDLRGGFCLITVKDPDSDEVVIYGTLHYDRNHEGELVIPPNATYDTFLLCRIVKALKKKFPKTIWKLHASSTES